MGWYKMRGETNRLYPYQYNAIRKVFMNALLQHHTDTELYKALLSPQRDNAFGELYRRYGTRIYLYCRRILGDGVLADDMFQETFISILRSADNGTNVENFPAYIHRIARNHCLRAKERKQQPLEFDEETMGTFDKSMEQKELSQMISMAIELLPEHHREAFVLQMYDDLSYEQIGEVLDVPVSTVRNWVVRAKKKLRLILSPYMDKVRNAPPDIFNA